MDNPQLYTKIVQVQRGHVYKLDLTIVDFMFDRLEGLAEYAYTNGEDHNPTEIPLGVPIPLVYACSDDNAFPVGGQMFGLDLRFEINTDKYQHLKDWCENGGPRVYVVDAFNEEILHMREEREPGKFRLMGMSPGHWNHTWTKAMDSMGPWYFFHQGLTIILTLWRDK